MSEPLAIHDFVELPAALEFLKRTRSELRSLRKVRVWRDRLQIFDINGDYFEVRGIGYSNVEMSNLLRAINTAFDPAALGELTHLDFKEFKTGRRHCWAEDRVM